jgi:hypothetical protein
MASMCPIKSANQSRFTTSAELQIEIIIFPSPIQNRLQFSINGSMFEPSKIKYELEII